MTPRTTESWGWRSLHLGVALSVPLLMLWLTGCLKGSTKPAILGPQVSSDVINGILAKEQSTANLNNLATGQYVDYQLTRRVETSDIDNNLGTQHVQVFDKQATSTQDNFTILITNSTRQADGSFQTVVSEDALVLSLSPAATIVSAVQKLTTRPSATLNAFLGFDTSTTPTAGSVTFHNLQQSDATLTLPPAVQARSGCGGLSPCADIPLHYVQFDMAVWSDSTNFTLTSFELGFAQVTPFIPFGSDFNLLTGLLAVQCRSGYIYVGSTNVFVRDCAALDDFQK